MLHKPQPKYGWHGGHATIGLGVRVRYMRPLAVFAEYFGKGEGIVEKGPHVTSDKRVIWEVAWEGALHHSWPVYADDLELV